jgi:hypothetical protein
MARRLYLTRIEESRRAVSVFYGPEIYSGTPASRCSYERAYASKGFNFPTHLN